MNLIIERLRNIYSDFKIGFKTNSYISNYSAGRAIGEFVKTAVTTFLITTVLSLSALFANENWNVVLSNAREEFLQITGLKLAFYAVLFLVAISLIFYKVSFLTKVLAWLVRSISNIGFNINAVLAGAIGGIIISDLLNPKIVTSIGSIIGLYLILFTLTVLFYLSTKIFSTGVRNEIDETLGKYKWIFTLAFGIILCIIWWFGVNDEPWV